MVDIVFDGSITGTGINLGDTTLSDYDEGPFTPTFSSTTPGDMSVIYATQTGQYTRNGRTVYIQVNLTCTPTFTTAAGNLVIGGFPFTVGSIDSGLSCYNSSVGITWGSGYTQLQAKANPSAATMNLNVTGSAKAVAALSPSAIVSGVAITLNISGSYTV